MKSHWMITLFLFFLVLTMKAKDIPKRTYEAIRLNVQVPKIDGQLDDLCWSGEGWADDFVQQQPHEGEPGTQKTEFKILYDSHYLYVGIRAFDNEPEKMDIRVSRRDNFAGDIVGICLDSYYDHRTGYEFNVTSGGTKIDLIQMDTGADWFFDMNWDAVWDGKAAVGDSVWTAEFRIPFNQLRFAEKEEQVWGIHVWRWLQRENEESQFQLIPLDSQGRVHRFGILKGIQGISKPRRIELLPYLRGSINYFKPVPGNPFLDSGKSLSQGLGLDGKIGVMGNFILDYTVNPDFGQVEADPSELNLTAFETFYEEKRPFFMEGKQVFDFSIDGQSLFYSRRIGRSPGCSPETGFGEYAETPDNTTILTAAKLSGKTANGWSVGVLSSLTAKETSEIRQGSDSRQVTSEPLSAYSATRFQRDFKGGSHSVGFMLTAVNRQINENQLRILPDAAYTGGFDGTFQWGNRTYYVNTKAAFSTIRGHALAITRLQRSSVHNYQREEAGHVRVDSSATVLSGTGGEIEVGKGGNGRWRFEENVTWRSPGFDLNDIGYLQQADLISQRTGIAYVVNEPGKWCSSYNYSFDQYNRWNFNNEYLVSGGELFGGWTFKNFWNYHGFIQHERSRMHTRLLRGGPVIRLPDVTHIHYHINSDSRKRFQYGLAFTHAFFKEEDASAYRALWGNVYVRASDNLDFSIQPEYIVNKDAWQYVRVEALSEKTPYVLGLIDQETFRLTFRLNYYITPDLSIQYYGQPFITAGRYSDFKRVTDADADRVKDRYLALSDQHVTENSENGLITVDDNQDGAADYTISNPDFNFREFHSNLVLRWEYRPGSTLYFVWTHGRSQYIQNGGFDLKHDMNALFGVYPDNVFLVKVNYWFSL